MDPRTDQSNGSPEYTREGPNIKRPIGKDR